MTMAKHCLKNSSGLRNPVPAWKRSKKKKIQKMYRELPLGFLSQYESNLKHRRHLLQSSTLHPPPKLRKKKKGAPTKGPNTLLFRLRWKIAQISSTCKKLGGKSLPVGYTYIYILLQNLLLQTGSFWQAEETWQWILTNLHERQITMVGEKIIKEKEKGKRKKKEKIAFL